MQEIINNNARDPGTGPTGVIIMQEIINNNARD